MYFLVFIIVTRLTSINRFVSFKRCFVSGAACCSACSCRSWCGSARTRRRGRSWPTRCVGGCNPFVPTVAFKLLSSNMCCPRDCVSRHNGGTSGAPIKPLRDDSALRTLSSLKGLKGAPEMAPLCRETSVSRTANETIVLSEHYRL